MRMTLCFVLSVLLTAAPSTVFAQARTIDGKAIPEGQAAAVEERCTELQHQQGTTGSQQPETSMDSSQEQRTAAAAGEAGALDVSSITLEQCIAGGFTAGSGATLQ